MKRIYTKTIGAATIMSIVLSATLPATLVRAAVGQVTKIGGADSYETAAIVATTNWTSAKDVILVCGEGYADAVSATLLAKQLNAPILLTTAASLNGNAKAALDKLKPQNIYIIGGNASVSQAVRDQLKNNNCNLIELGGKDRYETNIAVANQLIKLGVKADNVMLVSGEGFSDVLSATPVAAAKGQILLLGSNDKNTMKPVLDFVKANNSKVTVIGTSNSIKDDIYKSLGAVSRINGGADRFETNLNVLNNFNSDLKNDKLFIANASGDRYADALIAASLAGKSNSSLVLIDDASASGTSKAIDYIKSKVGTSTDLNLISETGVVSDDIISKINNAASNSTPSVDSTTVNSVTANGINQVKVVFNTNVDKDTAQLVSNYQIDGNNLGSSWQNQSTATLQDDNRTVLITFAHPFQQFQNVNFTVKNSILNQNSSGNIASFQQGITFSETSVPTLKSVTAIGGNKLEVKFSEPVRMSMSDLSNMKINRQSVANFGLNTSQTTFCDSSDVWSDRVDLYFNGPLPTGTNVFTVPNGDSGIRFDNAANFPLKGASMNFNVSLIGGAPQITSVTSNNLDTVYVTYDRSMDKQTALDMGNYQINGSNIYVGTSNISFDEGSSDTVVKIQNVSNLFKNGQNNMTISNNVQDTFGNAINQINMNFTIGNDAIKPTVTNAAVIDSKTLRVTFNKDVTNYYATDKSNYTIIDSDGQDISYKIDTIGAETINGSSNRTFDVRFNDNDALKGLKYTLTIKNIIDMNKAANVMDPYTTVITGLDTGLPSVTGIVKRADDAYGVTILFSKAMDETSITNPANYFFKNGSGETKKVPLSATITPSLDDKSVTIEFPSTFTIGSGPDSRYVVLMGVANVTDKQGNGLSTVAYTGPISTDYTTGPSLITNTAKLSVDGNDIKVRFSLTAPLDILSLNDFTVNGISPDGGNVVGNDVILTYKAGIKNNSKIDAIKNAGASTTVYVSNGGSVDAAGRRLKSGTDTVLIPPMTVPNSWTASTLSGRDTVTIEFNENIDDSIYGTYDNDFIFTDERTGQKLNVTSVSVNGKDVIYNFSYGTIMAGDIIDVHANNQPNTIDIRGARYGNGNYATYQPSIDDLSNRTITAK